MKPKSNADYLKDAGERIKDVEGSHVNYGNSKTKANKTLVASLIFLCVGIVLGGMVIWSLTPVNPLGQYINTRTCDFISMGGFQSAVCTDGTVWSVSPFQE